MEFASIVDTALDRSVLLGYGSVGLRVRRRLPGWPADPPRMDGALVLVTGAGSGIGAAAARGFAGLGASVLVVGRSLERAAHAAEQVRAAVADAQVTPLSCDVSSLRALRELIDRLRDGYDRLDVLVNNAGVMPAERTETPDGFELTFATQVLAPWVLTDGLAPLLSKATPGRVINVSSGGQYAQQIPIEDLQTKHQNYGSKKVYSQTKRELVVISERWAQQLRESGVVVHAMHPGWVDTKGVRQWLPVFRALTLPVMRTPEEGADTIVWLGGSPEAARTTGLFWQDRHPRPQTYRFAADPDDPGTRRRLWDELAEIASSVH